MASEPSAVNANNEQVLRELLIKLQLDLDLTKTKENLALLEAQLQAGDANLREIQERTAASNARAQMYEMEAEMCRVRTAAIKAGFEQNTAGEWVAPQVQEVPENDEDNPALEPAETTVVAEDDDGYHSEGSSRRSRSNSR